MLSSYVDFLQIKRNITHYYLNNSNPFILTLGSSKAFFSETGDPGHHPRFLEGIHIFHFAGLLLLLGQYLDHILVLL